MKRLQVSLVLCLFGILAGAGQAQSTATWTGLAGPTGGNYTFEQATNWLGNVVPSSGNHLVFGPGPTTNLLLSSPFTAGDITFSGIQNGFHLVGATTLTLTGSVTTTAGSQYWGLFSLPVSLTAGNHVYTAGGNASIYHFGAVSGAGGITKEGANGLYMTESSTYSGGTILNAGTLYVGEDDALGYGAVTLNGGTLGIAYAGGDVRLGNDFVFGANVNLDTSKFVIDEEAYSLILGNSEGSTMAPATGVSTVNFNLTGERPVYLTGDLEDGDGPTTYTFASTPGSGGYRLSGYDNTYTGGTLVKSGATVIFDYPASVPLSGTITSQIDGYVGIGDPSLQSAFLSRLNTASFAGTIGFDNDDTYAGSIDLTNFQQGLHVSIGTQSGAILTGPITPSSSIGGGYNFRSSDRLILNGNNGLTGNYGVLSRSLDDRPAGMVVLNQSVANTYTGDTLADGGGIVFDGPSSLPNSTNLNLANGGYISVTNNSGYTLDQLIDKVGSVSGSGAIGFDSHAHVHFGSGSASVSDPIDFSGLSQEVYLGSATDTSVTGSILTVNGDSGDYFFTGFAGGTLRVDSLLTGDKAVHIGLPGVFQDPDNSNAYSNVVLSNSANDYEGGTVLHSGYLQIQDILAIGSGDIVVQASGSDNSAALEAPHSSTLANNLVLDYGTLYLNGNITVSGEISGSGTVYVNNNMIFSGDNSHAHTVVDSEQLTAASDHALNGSSLELLKGASMLFTTPAPRIGSLLRGEEFYDDTDGVEQYPAALHLAGGATTTLTIDQAVDGVFFGGIAQSGTTGSVIKQGAGTLTIYGDLDVGDVAYSGGTTITSGRIVAAANGALGTGAITLNGGALGTSSGVTLTNAINFGANGGKLGGSGTISVPITAGPNVVIAPGESPGTLTFSSGLTLAGGGTLDFEVQSALGSAGAGYDLLSISGNPLTLSATAGDKFTLRVISLNALGDAGAVSDFSDATGYAWTFASSAVGITGFDPNAFEIMTSGTFSNSLNGGYFYVSLVGNDLILNFAPVPEPSVYALLAFGLGVVSFAARRRRK